MLRSVMVMLVAGLVLVIQPVASLTTERLGTLDVLDATGFDAMAPAVMGPVTACFDPEEMPPLEVIQAINDFIVNDPDGLRYQLASRWSGSQGSPRALTWSFVPDGLTIPSGINGDSTGPSNLFGRMDSLFAGQGGRATWVAQFEACFDRWAELTGTSYTRITFGGNDWDDGASRGSTGGSNHGDIRISMRDITVGGVLAFNSFPSNGDMVMDEPRNWSNSFGTYVFLRNVVMHEHGHGLGFFHSCPQQSTKLMEPAINTNFDGPQHDEIRGGQRHYGDPFEPDNSTGAATDLGTLAVGTTTDVGEVTPPVDFGSRLSIDDNGESDYFRFNLARAARLIVDVSPVGLQYDTSSQSCGTPDGCCNGNIIDSTERQNLAIQLLNSGGSVIESSGSQPVGVAEQIDTLVGFGGDYFVRVYETGSSESSQLYQLEISVQEADCNNNTLLDPCDLDCGAPGCDVAGCGLSNDCNTNGIPDECDDDCNVDGLADECAFVDGGADSTLVCPGGTVQFNVTAGPEVSGYQWLRNGVPLTDDARIAGAQTAALTVSNVVPNDEGSYTCELIDECVLIDATIASLDVISNGFISQQPPPSVAVCSGSTAVFTIQTGGGSPEPGYQWYREGVLLSEGAKYQGVTTNQLEVTGVEFADEGVFTCEVSSGCGSTLSNASELIVADPVFTDQPQSVCAPVGTPAVFTAPAVSGIGSVGYQWRRNGVPLTEGGVVSGVFTDTLTISEMDVSFLGLYSVLAFSSPSPICVLESDVAVLTTGTCGACATPGDFDADGDADLLDVQAFFTCIGEDVVSNEDCACANVDDGNTIVDLDDWDAFSQLMDGPL